MSLKAVRLVNRDISTLAAETMFCIVVLNNYGDDDDNDDENAKRFLEIVHSHLNELVHHVVINTSKHPEWETSKSGDHGETDIKESFKKAMGLLYKLKELDTVELKFARECQGPPAWTYSISKFIAESRHFREDILKTMFQALVGQETVKNLAIKNLQDHMAEEVFESNDFKVVRERLTKLHLQIATEDCEFSPENNINFPSCHQGFRYSLPNFWLKPTTTQLTHLSL